MDKPGLARDCPSCGVAVAAKATECGACGAALGRIRKTRRRSVPVGEPGGGPVDDDSWPEELHHLEDDEYEAYLAREFPERSSGLRRWRPLLVRGLVALVLLLFLIWVLRR